jgi:hypothetical protein
LAVSDVAPQFDARFNAEAQQARTILQQHVVGASPQDNHRNCRVVLLGASNLTRCISTVVETVENIRRPPLEIFVAAGLGRSYGIESRVLGRTLPGIIDCSLWEALARPPAVPTVALVTDIGNDILYGVEISQMVAWVESVLERLQNISADICMTMLPPADIESLSLARFYLFRKLFFPTCRLNRDTVLRRARELHDRLYELGASRSITVVQQRPDWYGWDPIHIRRRQWRHAWQNILSTWQEQAACSPAVAHGSLRRWLYLQTRRPNRRKLWGFEQSRQQPSAKLCNGTTVSFY